MSWKIGGIVKRSPEEMERISKEFEESVRRAVELGIEPIWGSSRLHWRARPLIEEIRWLVVLVLGGLRPEESVPYHLDLGHALPVACPVFLEGLVVLLPHHPSPLY